MRTLKTLPENVDGRDLVVGDIHGGHGVLMKELEIRRFDPQRDRVIGVGDLIDRGPDSYRCLQLVKEPWFYTVWGNHESLMLNALSSLPGSEAFRLWMQNGGEWAMNHDLDELHQEIIEMANTVPLALELPIDDTSIGIVHAEVPRNDWASWNRPLQPRDEQLAIWGRSTILGALADSDCTPVRGIDWVIFGHTPLAAPTTVTNRLYIDTGCGYAGGKLTIRELNSELFDAASNTPRLFQGGG